MPVPPDEKIAALAPEWVWGIRQCLATDPIGMEFTFEGDPAIRRQLAAVRLEAVATAYRAVADASAKAAAILAKSGGKS